MILNRDCFFYKKSDFINRLPDISEESICYIADTQQIYVQGRYFECNVTKDIVEQLIKSKGYLTAADLPVLTGGAAPLPGEFVTGVTVGGHNINVQKGKFSETNVGSASKLETPRTISLSGDVTGSAQFDGSEDINIEVGVRSSVYNSGISDQSLEMPEDVGGIKKGTTVGELDGQTINKIFDDLFFPTVNPTFSAPSASISFTSFSTIQIVGSKGPTQSNFRTSFNRGTISVNGERQDYRAGELITANSFIYVNGNVSNTTFPTTIPEGDTSFRYRAAYQEGPQPYDNKGNPYGSPLPAGTVDSNSISVNGTYPWYASTKTSGVLTQQSLVKWSSNMSTGNFVVQPHTSAAAQIFKLPRAAKSMTMLNTVSGKMESVSLSEWTSSTSIEYNRTYYTYTYSGADRGSVTLNVNF